MKKMLAILFCFILVFTCAAAHPGRTDANGGHWDHSTGEYHYHHGYEAHQHPDGICPYDYDDQTGASSGTSSAGAVAASSPDAVTNTIDESEVIAWGDGSYEGAYNQGYQYAIEALVPPESDLPETIYAAASYFCKTKALPGQTSYEAAGSSYDEAYEDGYLAATSDMNEFISIVYPNGVPKSNDEEQQGNEEYPYYRDDGTYETAYNAGYTRGCALLIELHSDMLPDISMLTGKLSESNRLEGSTSLEDHGATFESAYEDGYYQSETDLFNTLNELILQSDSEKPQPTPVHNTSRTIFVAILVFVILIAAALIYIVYRCMGKQIDELRSKLEKQNKFMDQVLEIKREKPYHTPTVEELRDILRKL